MRSIRLAPVLFTLCLMAVAASGFAQSPTPTGTPVTTPAATATATPSTPTPTPTPTPPAASVSFDASSLTVGQAVTASGTGANGDYCLCMVPAGVFSLGTTYSGTPVACVDLTISGNTFSGVTVVSAAPAGQYDLLLSVGACGTGGVITAGDELDDRVGLDIGAAAGIPSVSATGSLAVLMLIAAAGAFLLWRRN